MDYSPLLWGIFLKNITIGFPHSPKPSPMTSGHHTSWNSDMKDNHSLVSRETERERERERESLQIPTLLKRNTSHRPKKNKGRYRYPRKSKKSRIPEPELKIYSFLKELLLEILRFWHTAKSRKSEILPSEASYVDKQNVWEGSTKIDFSSIITFNIQFLESPKVCECCPKTLQNPLKHHM